MALNDAASAATCFVIGPIGDKDAEIGTPERNSYEDAVQVLEQVIQPACEAYGITVLRADQIHTTGEIPEQVFRHLRDAYLVIADLTGGNPNVFYELGMRHTTGKLTIQIGERERLPFDVSIVRTILFRRTPGGLIDARRSLSAAIGAGVERGGDPVTATRVWFESAPIDVEPVSTASSADEEGPGFLEVLADMSEGIGSANLSLTAIAEVIGRIDKQVGAATVRMTKANATGAPASARVSITNELASELEEPASRLAVLVGDYSQSMERMSPGIQFALKVARDQPENQDAVSFKEMVVGMVRAARETLPKIEYFRKTLLETGEASRALRRVNGKIAASLQQILDTHRIFESWDPLL